MEENKIRNEIKIKSIEIMMLSEKLKSKLEGYYVKRMGSNILNKIVGNEIKETINN